MSTSEFKSNSEFSWGPGGPQVTLTMPLDDAVRLLKWLDTLTGNAPYEIGDVKSELRTGVREAEAALYKAGFVRRG